MADLTKLGIGTFIVLSLIGVTYMIAEGDKAFFCKDNDIVGICYKLSEANSEGLRTRCYFNESSPTKYKNCPSGWELFKSQEVTGTITNLPDNKVLEITTVNKNLFLTSEINYSVIQCHLNNCNFELNIKNGTKVSKTKLYILNGTDEKLTLKRNQAIQSYLNSLNRTYKIVYENRLNSGILTII